MGGPDAAPGVRSNARATPLFPETAGALGTVVWLMTQSPAHRHFFIADVEWMVQPALAHRQYRIYRREDVPIGYASWAFIDATREERFRKGELRLAPNEWLCGKQLWLFDLIAPFGAADEILGDLRMNVFPGQAILTMQTTSQGRAVVEWAPVGPAAGDEHAATTSAQANNGSGGVTVSDETEGVRAE